MCVIYLCFSFEENVYVVPWLIQIKLLLNSQMIFFVVWQWDRPMPFFICRNKQKTENGLTEMICCFGLQPWKGMAFAGLHVSPAVGSTHFYG